MMVEVEASVMLCIAGDFNAHVGSAEVGLDGEQEKFLYEASYIVIIIYVCMNSLVVHIITL